MANPDPEIWPPDAKAARPDAIIATGRSDFPNQVNNVLGFPFIFRGALDVRATAINEEMKIAAAEALAELAREPVPEEVAAAYGGRSHSFGRDYIIPAPFDPRLMEVVASAVAEAAMQTGVAQKPIADMDAYRQAAARAAQPDRRGDEPRLRSGARRTRSACCSRKARSPTCCAPRSRSRKAATARRCWSGARTSTTCCKEMGVDDPKEYEVLNSRNSPLVGRAVDYIYAKHQRHGMLRREIERMVNQDRNYFAAAMLALGEADAMITGTTRPFSQSLSQVRTVIDDEPGRDAVRDQRHRRPQPHGADRRHRGDRAADRRAICGDRHALVGLRPAHGARAARRVHQLHDLRQSAGHAHRGAARRGEAARRLPGRLRI